MVQKDPGLVRRTIAFILEHWGKVGSAVAITGLTAIVPGMFSDLYADKLARWFSHNHLIVAQPVKFRRAGYPNCTVYEISLIPRQNITHLDLGLRFDQEISSALVRQVPLDDYSGKHGSTVKGNVSLKKPCEFDAETATPNSDAFSLNLSSDRKIAFIKARDYGPEDSRDVVLLFYPDYGFNMVGDPSSHVRATYTAYGREVRADFAWQGPVVNVQDHSQAN
jgi:hypothetical protein